MQAGPLVLVLVPAALEVDGAAECDKQDGEEERPDADGGRPRHHHFRSDRGRSR